LAEFPIPPTPASTLRRPTSLLPSTSPTRVVAHTPGTASSSTAFTQAVHITTKDCRSSSTLEIQTSNYLLTLSLPTMTSGASTRMAQLIVALSPQICGLALAAALFTSTQLISLDPTATAAVQAQCYPLLMEVRTGSEIRSSRT
jgi:hypothetical protein